MEALPCRNQWHRCQCGQQPYEPPAAEVFLQNNSRQQDCYRRVQRRNHYGLVQAAVLAGEDEQCYANDIETAGKSAEGGCGAVELERSAGREDRN